MLVNYSIKDLYSLALAEGEGMGTAYEYYVKRLALNRMLARIRRPKSILIAGLPEKYGASLDFMLLGAELGARITVVDDRPAALQRLSDALAILAITPHAPPIEPPAAMVLSDLDTLNAINGRFDLVLSSETLQRFPPASRATYVRRLRQMAPALALFSPNADNKAHNTRSGLAGLSLEELSELAGESQSPMRVSATGEDRSTIAGYIDMPPFPPGITRSDEQREEATHGRFEALVMGGLGRYAHVERFLPMVLRRNQSHIVYALINGDVQ